MSLDPRLKPARTNGGQPKPFERLSVMSLSILCRAQPAPDQVTSIATSRREGCEMSPEYLARLYVIAWLKVANRNPESGQMNETECCWSNKQKRTGVSEN